MLPSGLLGRCLLPLRAGLHPRPELAGIAVRVMLLNLTADELWFIRDLVRQTDQQGREWDQGFQKRLYAALAIATDTTPADLEIEDVEELWQLTRQIHSQLMVGGKNVGRPLLLKIQAAILAWTPVNHDDEPTEAALPGYIERWEAERAAAERGFQEWEAGT